MFRAIDRENPDVIAYPSTLVRKRLEDRVISEGERMIADLRTANVSATKGDYHNTVAPNVQALAKRVGILKRRFPGKRIVCTKRAIDSAFRRSNIHPDATVIMDTELVGQELQFGDDPIFLYLSIRFGREGSPGISTIVGIISRKSRTATGR